MAGPMIADAPELWYCTRRQSPGDRRVGFPITLLMCCRKAGNDNSRLDLLLESLVQHADNPANAEMLIKFDDDDPDLGDSLRIIDQFKDRLAIRYIVTSRAGGYGDLHKAVLDLLRIADPASVVFWGLCDDIEITSPGWDTKILARCDDYDDGLFLLHFLHMKDFTKLSQREAIGGPEPLPAWSRKWLGLQGGFGYVFACDGWTCLLSHRLATAYGIDRRILVDGVTFSRRISAIDQEGSERWNGIRRITHDQMMSPQLQSLVDCTAQAFACYLFAHGAPPYEPKGFAERIYRKLFRRTPRPSPLPFPALQRSK
jgi:hypothetical protein